MFITKPGMLSLRLHQHFVLAQLAPVIKVKKPGVEFIIILSWSKRAELFQAGWRHQGIRPGASATSSYGVNLAVEDSMVAMGDEIAQSRGE